MTLGGGGLTPLMNLFARPEVTSSGRTRPMQKILMVAFHYPPYEGGSGIHRTLKFSRYLPAFGWSPIVLSAHPRAYPKVGDHQLREIPREVIVKRAFALDAAKHLSIRGRYCRLLALPDQWVSWFVGAILSGLRLVRKHRPAVLWSTYPIATAHLIGVMLHRLTGVPWVADFRDSMTEENYPRDQWARKSYLWIEKSAVNYAARLVFTAPSTRQMYLQRYPKLKADRCVLIPNGYDEEDFVGLNALETKKGVDGQPLRIVHAGLIYPEERDPRTFFNALSRLKAEGKICDNNFSFDLRASGSEGYYTKLIADLGIDDIVSLLPALPYLEAIEDCAEADALLLFQAASCNHQIPAKVYEYLRLGKPILALTPEEGDTGNLLREIGGATIVDLSDEEAIYRVIPLFLNSVRKNAHPLPQPEKVYRYSRNRQAARLSECLSELTIQN